MKYDNKCFLLVLVISLFMGIIIPCSAEGFVENEDKNIQLVSLEGLKNFKGREESGDCGENVHWTFNSGSGVLRISGTGEMENFTSLTSPFTKRKDSIKSVIIEKGVTSIGKYAFYDCGELTSINIPNSVTYIGANAFTICGGLTSINIPNSVTSIGKSVFYLCNGLTSVNIPESVSSIEIGAFSGCNNLKSLYYQGNSFISTSVFYSGSTPLENICVSPDYNYPTFGERNVTSDTTNCIAFRNKFNKCYIGAYIDNDFTAVKRKEFIEFEKQKTGCIEHTCDNNIGLVTWSICNSTDSKNLLCMNDKCIEEDKATNDDKVKIDIEIEAEILSVTMNTTDFLNKLCEDLGIEKGTLNMAYETNSKGYIVRIILFVNDEAEANSIAEEIKETKIIKVKNVIIITKAFSGTNKHSHVMTLFVIFIMFFITFC